MMVPDDFGQNFGEEKDMPSSDMQEKTPGVYVRANDNELPHELDMLWSNSRPYQREERSPLVSFIVGMLVGGILTTAVFLLFVMHPQVKTGESEITAPISEEMNAGHQQQPGTSATIPGGATSGTKTSQGAVAPGTQGSTSYTVVTGDSLGRIAQKVYGSSDPKYIDKIQRANNMSSPDKLQINQTLVIPPRDY
jgi:nucleoid-associated protein YgaU